MKHRSLLATGVIMATLTLTACNNNQETNNTDNMKQELTLTQEWDKVFPLSEKVNHRKVTFETQYGLTLAADLYTPKDAQGKLAAIAVSGPFGAVKEQSSGLYAMRMAERGFVALAFDPSYTGESSGEPRRTASPDINTEDFMAAVDFLSKLEDVDPERIGIIGICGWGGIALNAAAADTRIKATIASTMYDMSRISGNGYYDSEDKEESRHAAREAMGKQARLPQAQRQQQRRLAHHRHPGLRQCPLPLLHQRNPICRPRDAWRGGPLALLWRGCLSLHGGWKGRRLQLHRQAQSCAREQAAAHHTRCHPLRPLRRRRE